MFKKTENANPNYLATICKIEETFPIEGADRLVRTVINGFDMVVSKDMKLGDTVLYFPVETAICEKFLSANNLYELSEAHRNRNGVEVEKLLIATQNESDSANIKELMDTAKSMCGFFNKRGRVRMLKLRGQYSMGFVIPVTALLNAWPELIGVNFEDHIGESFDEVCGEVLCWKYVPVTKEPHKLCDPRDGRWKKLMKKTRERFDKLIEGQFEFHYDTKQIENDIEILKPETEVTVSVKVHGTSVILSNILCNRKLGLWEKFKKFFGGNVETTEYSNIYASRKVIKNRYLAKGSTDYYGTDIWGDVNKVFAQFLSPGMTVYGEIVGYLTGSSQYIQKNHDYGCQPGQWKFMPYRITLTGVDGSKTELSVLDVQDWISHINENFGDLPAYDHYKIKDVLMPMNILYVGELGGMYPINQEHHFAKNLLQTMKEDTKWLLMEKNEPMCNNKVPREGVVIRINDDKVARAWKLKSKAHYELETKQHDKGETDIEETA